MAAASRTSSQAYRRRVSSKTWLVPPCLLRAEARSSIAARKTASIIIVSSGVHPTTAPNIQDSNFGHGEARSKLSWCLGSPHYVQGPPHLSVDGIKSSDLSSVKHGALSSPGPSGMDQEANGRLHLYSHSEEVS